MRAAIPKTPKMVPQGAFCFLPAGRPLFQMGKRLQYRRVTQNVLMISQKEITNGCSSHVLILVLLEDAGYASEDTENTLQFLT
jgi:hypothetical protein